MKTVDPAGMAQNPLAEMTRRILFRAVWICLLGFFLAQFFHLSISLWADEFGPWAFLKSSLAETIRQMSLRGQHPPLYQIVVWFVTSVLGTGEMALRMPSYLAELVLTFCYYKLLRSELRATEALAGTVFLLALPEVQDASVYARPYALGLLLACCSIFAVRKWIDERSHRSSLIAGAVCGLVVDIHVIYGTIIPAFLMAFLFVNRRENVSLTKSIGLFLISSAIMSLPAVLTLLRLVQLPASYNYLYVPGMSWLAVVLAPPVLLLPCILLFVAKALPFGPPRSEPGTLACHLPRRLLPIMLCLYVVPVFICFAASNIMATMSVWDTKHFLIFELGTCYLAVLLFRKIGCGENVLLAIALFLIVASGIDIVKAQRVQRENWRAAYQFLNEVAPADAIVMITSGHVEGDIPEHFTNATDLFHLNISAHYYGLKRQFIAFPKHAEKLPSQAISAIEQARRKTNTFYLISQLASPENVLFISDSLRKLGKCSFSRELKRFGEISLVRFDVHDEAA